MSRRLSRFHALELSLKAPRKPRSQARALTVMRLEGGVAGAQSNARPARLPRDMEDQVAVVRGRAVGKPSRGLQQLEQRLLHGPDAGPIALAVQRHDHGARPVGAAPALQASAFAAPMAGGAFGGTYRVESFEDPAAATPAKPADSPGSEFTTGAALAQIQAPPAAEAPAYGPAPWSVPQAETTGSAVPWASEQSKRATRPRLLTEDQLAVAANFERDVSAMLGTASTGNAPEDRQWNDTLRNAGNAPAPANPPAVDPASTLAAPTRDAHDVFSRMGLAMNFANSFDLGAMDLSARFDQFDSELALAVNPARAASIPIEALGLDDFDVVADLAEISGAQSVAPAAPPVCSDE